MSGDHHVRGNCGKEWGRDLVPSIFTQRRIVALRQAILPFSKAENMATWVSVESTAANPHTKRLNRNALNYSHFRGII